MNGTESFLKRWSRRKAESAEGSEVSPAGPAPAPEEAKPKTGQATPAPPPETSEPAQAAFDPASLPRIESIDASADIRPFMQAGAPAELTQAALRRAWATDPAIRDFIGIAENQWDFNDPTAMPGFGPLSAADGAAALAAQMLGVASDRSAQIGETSVSPAPAEPEAIGQLPRKLAPPAETAGLAEEPIEGNVAGDHDDPPGESGAPRNRRSHGGALPH